MVKRFPEVLHGEEKRHSSFYHRGFFLSVSRLFSSWKATLKGVLIRVLFAIYMYFFPNRYKMIIKIKGSLPFIQLRLMFLQDKTVVA